MALAETLGDFVPLVGGIKKASCLLVPLETLCVVEDNIVREKAVASLLKIAGQMKSDMIEENFRPLFLNLSKQDQWFTSRASACGLVSTVYGSLSSNEDKSTIREYVTFIEVTIYVVCLKLSLFYFFFLIRIYLRLCRDETPMVRRAAFMHLGELSEKFSKDHLSSVLLPIFNTFSQDQQDSVRLLAVENCISFSKQLSTEETEKYILPLVQQSAKDKSWRVRYMVAEHFKSLCQVLLGITDKGSSQSKGNTTTASSSTTTVESEADSKRVKELLLCFEELCKDTETEVRTAAACRIADVSLILLNGHKETVIDEVMPIVRLLVSDKSEHVRAALGSVIMGLSPILGKDGTIECLLPVFLQLLKDPFPDVRLNIISKLDAVNKVVGVELLAQSLLPAIVELAEDKQWRVRMAIIEYIPLLSSQLGSKFFDDKLSTLSMTWLKDSVFSIREAAINNFKKLTEIFGEEWCQSSLLPKIGQMAENPNYLYRITTLLSFNVLIPILQPEIVASDAILKVTLHLADDPVPNIRFNVAKTLEILIKFVNPKLVATVIKDKLTKMQQDQDTDVRAFAIQALSKC